MEQDDAPEKQLDNVESEHKDSETTSERQVVHHWDMGTLWRFLNDRVGV